MPTALESKAALELLTADAVATVNSYAARVQGSAEVRRAATLEAVPEIVGYYSLGAAALAADFYEDARESAGAAGRFTATAVVADRTVRVRRGVAWATEPWFEDLDQTVDERFALIVGGEVPRGYRDTILTNRRADSEAIGWQRIASPIACKFCRFLAANGAVYKESTVRFAAHGDCSCTAAPVFKGGATGPEASVEQYTASRRARTDRDRARLREWLNAAYPDVRG